MENTNKLPIEFKTKWVAALRSGEFKQGNLKLYNEKNNTYCCLGVACVIAGIDKNNTDVMDRGYIYSRNIKSDEIKEQLKPLFFDNNNVSPLVLKLTTMNDVDKKSFNEIADYIEVEL